MNAARVVHVAVAVIADAAGRVLVAQRLPHQHLAGLWEFPGGKLEAGESLHDGMRREIREELGIEAEAIAPLLRIEHCYPEKTVLLDVWRVLAWSGAAPGERGAEGQPLRWLHPEVMDPREFPPADVPVINALRLPSHYIISPDIDAADAILPWVSAVSRSGVPVRLVQVRLKRVPALARELVSAIRAAWPGVKILLNSDTQAALQHASPADAYCGADGLHLTARKLRDCTEKPASLCAASCHDADELALAFARGLDFVTLGAVLPTESHPAVAGLGWREFCALTAGAGLPVFALGGMQIDTLADAISHGAVGVAGISMFAG
jgi:8-oxo-dGTP diphosphatase